MNCTDILSGIKQLPTMGHDFKYDDVIRCLDYNISVFGHDEIPLKEYKAYKIRENLILFISPILLLIGTVGNLFTFIVMAAHASKISTYSYLSALALLDLFVLYVGLFRLWIAQLTGVDITDQSDLLCKLVNFLAYTFSDSSVWLIILVTVERYIAVCHPLKATLFCDARRTRFMLLIPIIMFSFLNGHFFWTVELSTNRFNPVICDAAPSFQYLVNIVWPWIDAAMYSFFPLGIISILNGFIIQQVFTAKKKRERFLQEKQKSKLIMHQSKSTEGSKRLTFMLLTVSFSFLLTTLPSNIAVIVLGFWNSSGQEDLGKLATISLIKVIGELLMYVNHSINFFLYCATGNKFRNTLVKMICRRCKRYRNGSEAIIVNRTKCSIRLSVYGTDRTIIQNTV